MFVGKILKKKLNLTANQPKPKTIGKALAKFDMKENKVPPKGNELAHIKLRLARCGMNKEEATEVFWAYKETIGRGLILFNNKESEESDT
jgi:hypothetical protein